MEIVRKPDYDPNSPQARGFPLIEPIIAVNPGAGPEYPCEVTNDPRPEWLKVTKKKLIEEYAKKKNLDITLAMDDGTVQVHCSVICMYFEPFRDMFKNNKKGYNVVRIFNVNAEAVASALDYLYFGETIVKDRSLGMLLKFIKCLEYPNTFCEDPVRMHLVLNHFDVQRFQPAPLRPEVPPPPPPRRRSLAQSRGGGIWNRGRNLFMLRNEPQGTSTQGGFGVRGPRASTTSGRRVSNPSSSLATLSEEEEEDKKQSE